MTPFSLTACWIWVFDDSVYEGPEDLTVRLGTNSTWVVLSRARAKVIITDEEDGKVMSELNLSYFDTDIVLSLSQYKYARMCVLTILLSVVPRPV